MDELSIKFLLFFSSLLGISSIPTNSETWTVSQPWDTNARYPALIANSLAVPEICRKNPQKQVRFPIIVHGAHEISVDGTLVYTFGYTNFDKVRSFYGAPVIPCHLLNKGNELEWKVTSYTHYFARFSHFPEVVSSSYLNFFTETLNVVAAGTIFLLGFVNLIIFWGKISRRLNFFIFASNIIFSMYFFCSVTEAFNIQLSMKTAHQLADTGVWGGMIFLFASFKEHKLVGNKLFYSFLALTIIALLMILTGSSGDIIQMGTTIPFPLTLTVLGVCLFNCLKNFKRPKLKGQTIFELLSISLFASFCMNDILVILGLIPNYPASPIGFIGGMAFFALSVNQEITQIYVERDYLRKNLENEIERKTEQLQRKTKDLETALSHLQVTQAELIQSAKLASLGTLAAGIAHEINNSLNYVYGSLKPIEKMIGEIPDLQKAEKIKKLLLTMGEGLRLTFEIIKSLKTHTGLNQAKFNDMNLKELIQDVLTLLKSKVKDKYVVEIKIPESLSLFGNVVGLNQVFTNLISNAVDAMPNGGKITVKASQNETQTHIVVEDTGNGIASENLSRIFEPFFTTKKVGQGTGLGLHIIRNEIEKHKGTIHVKSELGKGTSFSIEIPRQSGEESLAA